LNSKHYAVLIVVVALLFVIPLVLLPGAEFGGADSGAEQVISDTGYTPWFTSIWQPPSSEIETLLFSLQAAIGAIIIGYFVGYERGKRVGQKQKQPLKQ
jgi:cobalt/nickel transport protein